VSDHASDGKGFPATEPVVCTQGQTVRIRFMTGRVVRKAGVA